MKMRKQGIVFAIAALVLTAVLALGVSAANVGDIIGNTLYTDIVAYIDDKPIQSHNINGYTAVVAEDLANYGFEVIWNGTSRALYINEGDAVVKNINFTTVTVTPDMIGRKFRDVRFTDIKTYLNDKLVQSYNIGGYTIIMFEDLVANGDVKYDNGKRRIDFKRRGGNSANAGKIKDVYIIPEESIYLKPGESFEFEAIAEYGDGKTEDYTEKLYPYVYSGSDYIKISGTKVTALANGEAVIKFNGKEVKNDKVKVSVNETGTTPGVTSVALTSATSATLAVGDSFEIKATATYSDGRTDSAFSDLKAYVYTGSGVITIKNNKVTAIAKGTARIKFNNNYLYGTEITVSVVDKENTIKSVSLDETTKNVSVGKSFTITATAEYYSGAEKKYTSFTPYIYSGSSYITLTGKTVKGVKAGTAKIKFEDEFLSGKILTVKVNGDDEIESVSLDYTSKTVAIGKTFTITATAEYEDGDEKAFTDFEPYISSGSSYITLSGKKVKGVKAGTAKIKFYDDYLKNVTLTVKVSNSSDDEIAGVYLDYTSKTIAVGKSFTIGATVEYEDGEEDAFTDFEPYISSGSSYVTLSGKKVKGVKAGTAKIKFRDDYLSNKTLTVKVTDSSDDEIADVYLDYTSKTVAVGKSFTIGATVEYEDGEEDAFTDFEPYISSGSSYITLSGKNVKGVKAGTAKIKFRDEYLSNKTLTVKVTSSSDDEIEDVYLDFTSKTIAVGKTFTITATAEYEDGDEDVFTDFEPYIASGSAYVTLSGKKIKGVKEGTAKIKFRDEYLSGKTLTVKVTDDSEDSDEIESVEITSSMDKELAVGKSFTITAKATYGDGTKKTYTNLQPYIYSGEKYITLSENKITAKAAGMAKIKFENEYLTGETVIVTVLGDDAISTVTLDTATTQKIKVGESFEIEATAKYTDGSTEEYFDLEPYNSSDNGIVKIKNNTITGVAGGTCTIKFGSEYVTKTIKVTVTDPTEDIKSVKLDTEKMTLAVGDKVSITATITYNDKTTEDYTDFTAKVTSGTKYITLDDDGVITAKAAGTAKITFTDDWLDGEILTVTVVGEEINEIKSVTLNSAKIKTLNTSNSFTILATAEYQNNHTQSYDEDLKAYVYSGDKDCVVIEGNKVIAVRAGECKIRFKNTYLTSSTNYINVTVKGDGYIVEVTPSVTKKTIKVGDSFTVEATAEYYDGKTEDYTKDLGMTTTSSCIEIDGNEITALKAGTATVKFTDSHLNSSTITVTVEAAEEESTENTENTGNTEN